MPLITSIAYDRLSLYETDGVEYGLAQEEVMASLRAALEAKEAIEKRCGDVEKKLRTCDVEIIPLRSGGWEIYADFGENSNCHVVSDASKSLWDLLSEIDSPFHRPLTTHKL